MITKIGNRIEERGLLVRSGEQLLCRRELGGRMKIERRVVADLTIGMSGRLIGTIVGDNIVALSRFVPDA